MQRKLRFCRVVAALETLTVAALVTSIPARPSKGPATHCGHCHLQCRPVAANLRDRGGYIGDCQVGSHLVCLNSTSPIACHCCDELWASMQDSAPSISPSKVTTDWIYETVDDVLP